MRKSVQDEIADCFIKGLETGVLPPTDMHHKDLSTTPTVDECIQFIHTVLGKCTTWDGKYLDRIGILFDVLDRNSAFCGTELFEVALKIHSRTHM
jgi:hypothetical protein